MLLINSIQPSSFSSSSSSLSSSSALPMHIQRPCRRQNDLNDNEHDTQSRSRCSCQHGFRVIYRAPKFRYGRIEYHGKGSRCPHTRSTTTTTHALYILPPQRATVNYRAPIILSPSWLQEKKVHASRQCHQPRMGRRSRTAHPRALAPRFHGSAS